MTDFRNFRRPGLALALAATVLGGCSLDSYERTYAEMDRANARFEYVYSNTRSRMHSPEATRIPVGQQSVAETVLFAPRSAALGPGQRAQIDAFVARHALAGGAVAVAVVPEPGPSGTNLAYRRAAAIASQLGHRGVRASTTLAAGAPGSATISASRFAASLPNCPEWRELHTTGDIDVFTYKLGCLNASALAATVHRPADLVSGRPLGNAKGGDFDRGHGDFRDGKSDPPPKPDGFSFGGGSGSSGSGSQSGGQK